MDPNPTTLDSDSVTFTEFGGTAKGWKNWLTDVTTIVGDKLNPAGVSVGAQTNISAVYPVVDGNYPTGLALTVVFNDPSADTGTTLFQFGHANTTEEVTTLNFSALPSSPTSAPLSLGIRWSVQGSNTATDKSLIEVKASSDASETTLSALAGGMEDSDNTAARCITVGGSVG